MKIQWDFDRNYQTEAVNAVIDLFKGQNSMLHYFTVIGHTSIDSSSGIGNKIDLFHEDILENLRKVQIYQKLVPSNYLNSLDFEIEMANGTGKTYVYLKTIFELNKNYGFTKFIIVVSNKYQLKYVNNFIKDTKEHFKSYYDNLNFDYFVYDSSNLEQVRNFAVNSNIQIMIINIDAFNKNFNDSSKETKTNIIHRKQDELNGYKPIDLIAETNPIVIIDEPQYVMGGKGEEVVSYLNPLCTLRYSASHKEIQNLIYKLDAVDASEMGLNKQIELISFEYPIFMNDNYINLISINRRKSFNSARIEINANVNGKLKRKKVTVKEGFDLSEFKLSNLEVYEGWIVEEINADEGYISFANCDEILKIGNSINNLDKLVIKRFKVRKTIEEHLNKELTILNNNYDIKVFSVFIFDDFNNLVKKSTNNFINDDNLRLFEEEFISILNNPYFSKLNYFKNHEIKDFYKIFYSKDLDADELYDSNFKFIFLNSDLIKDFSNTNIFQVCNLTNSNKLSNIDQMNIGIQLCIDVDGNVVYNKNINKLSIITTESSSDFARNLQNAIEINSGIQFRTIKRNDFANIIWVNKKGISEPLGMERSNELYEYMILMNYIDKNGRVLNKLKKDLEYEYFDVPEDYQSIKNSISEIINKIF